MREIKFRGLDVMTGDWVYGNLVQTGAGMHYIIPRNFIADVIPQWRVDKETVGQFTGLKDCNDNEIYESDLIDCNGGIGKIVYSNEEAAFRVEISVNDRCWLDSLEMWSDETKVIGNVHENPEILEGEE